MGNLWETMGTHGKPLGTLAVARILATSISMTFFCFFYIESERPYPYRAVARILATFLISMPFFFFLFIFTLKGNGHGHIVLWLAFWTLF